MFRKSVLALAAIGTLGFTALSATEASARPWRGGGWHGYHGYHGYHRGFGVGLGVLGLATIVAATAPRAYCYNVITPRGFVRTVCE